MSVNNLMMLFSVVESTSMPSYENLKESELLELKNYGDLNRVLHVTAWVRRFIHNARGNPKRAGALSTEEKAEAEFPWIQATQNQSFLEEISLLKRGKEINSQSQTQFLSPFLDEKGILRVGSRLQTTNWNFKHKKIT